MFKNRKFITLLLPIQILLVNWLSNYPNIIEKYYSNGIYAYISSFFRIILGWIPFSIGDILLFISFIYIVKSLWKFIFMKNKNYETVLFNIGSKLSILYFCFYLFWGMNYYRTPLQESMQLPVSEYNIEELTFLTEKLLLKTQEIHFELTQNDTIPVQSVFSQTELLNKTGEGYDLLAEKYPQFNYSFPKVKKSLFSTPMSFMGFTGYINPLTGESQVNYNVLDFSTPAIASHEVAHQIGYANESEANFIGYLAAINHTDLLFQYSGFLLALDYALGTIYKNDKEIFDEIRNRLPLGVKKNLEERYLLHEKYKTPLRSFFHKIYNTYLKMNHQKDGMKSYGKMIELLLAYEKLE